MVEVAKPLEPNWYKVDKAFAPSPKREAKSDSTRIITANSIKV